MTANELVDKLERICLLNEAFLVADLEQAFLMLRQQQAEIEALHKLVKEQDMKIIDLAFDLEYAKCTDEFVNWSEK